MLQNLRPLTFVSMSSVIPPFELILLSRLRSSLNKPAGYESLVKAYHPESFVNHPEPFGPCHPEQREGSDPAHGTLCEESQDKLREGS